MGNEKNLKDKNTDIKGEPVLLADEIAQGIAERIQSGQYLAGQRLPVRALCQEFGVSETPVKQALNQLLSTGLVDSIPKCGMRVHTYEFQDIKENLEARMMIELYCAESAVQLVQRDEGFVERVERAFNETTELDRACIKNFTRENYNRITEPDRRMHFEIVQSCGNSQIIRMYTDLNAHKSMFIGFEGHSPESLERTIREHQRIIDSLLQCDATGLRKAIRAHIATTTKVQRDAWKKRNQKAKG